MNINDPSLHSFPRQVTPAGEIFVVGSTDSTSLDGQSNAGGHDAFLMKFDAFGQHLWTKLFGSLEDDYATDLTVEQRRSRFGDDNQSKIRN